MKDYKKLIEALRYCGKSECSEKCTYYVAEADQCYVSKRMTDAADAIEEMSKHIAEMHETVTRLQMRCAENEPKHGEWISDFPNGLFENVNPWKCSVCGKHYHFREDYCPNCGAKMSTQSNDSNALDALDALDVLGKEKE